MDNQECVDQFTAALRNAPRLRGSDTDLIAQFTRETRELADLLHLIDEALKARFGPRVTMTVEPGHAAGVGNAVVSKIMVTQPSREPLALRIIFQGQSYRVERTDRLPDYKEFVWPDGVGEYVVGHILSYFVKPNP